MFFFFIIFIFSIRFQNVRKVTTLFYNMQEKKAEKYAFGYYAKENDHPLEDIFSI